MRMKIFHFDDSYITRRRKRLSFPDAQCPKILLNLSISKSSITYPKRLYTNTLFLAPPFKTKNAKNHAISLPQMQASFTTQKNECNYLICLILMYKEIKCKSFNAPLLSIKIKSEMQMQKTQSKKGFIQSMHSKQ
jgi:hypothetical protein